MSGRIDHAAEARKNLAELDVTDPNSSNLPADWCGASEDEQWLVHATIEEAQVHATLALVEQQRIANLIAIGAAGKQSPLKWEPRDDIREGLGL